jgi:endonuclease III
MTRMFRASASSSERNGNNEKRMRNRLVDRGRALFKAPREPIAFTHDPAANALLNDLLGHPHAFVLACVMDRQIKAEKAWLIPFKMSEKLKGFSMAALSRLSSAKTNALMTSPEPLHRFVDLMSECFYSAVQRIHTRYGDEASRIWSGKPPSAEVVYRFLEFDGVGPKIASMATNILAREFKIPFADYISIDISADVHVRRVFSRLGFCTTDPTVDQVIYKARALYPEFPGIMDHACWEIGRKWCGPTRLECSECYMRDLCPGTRTKTA